MIKLSGVDKYFNKGRQNEIHVINNITLELPDKGIVAIFGRSGCGKTTLLNVIGGLDSINSGKISVDGMDISQNTDTVRNKYIGYIFQNYYLDNNSTVYENVASALRLCGMTDEHEIKKRVTSALSNVGMQKYERRLPGALSGGQQQRVAIARAIVKAPRVILADEPTGNLDESNTIMVMNMLKKISERCLVLLVTHEANLVDFYCDKVYGIVDGRLDFEKTNSDVRGYRAKGKNDIYLGELECQREIIGGASIAYYGDTDKKIDIQIVNYGGHIYLSSDSPGVSFIDKSSEIKLHDGVFEKEVDSSVTGEAAENGIDMSDLTPFDGKKFGSMFNFRTSLSAAYRNNFAKGQIRRKRSVKLLRLVMIVMSFVLVFNVALSAISIKNYIDVRQKYNENVYIVPIYEDFDVSGIADSIGKNGIRYARVMVSYNNGGDDLFFSTGKFNTLDTYKIGVSAFILPSYISDTLELVAGTTEPETYDGIVISTATADKIIEQCGLSSVSDYEDVIGFVSDDGLVVSGVVRSPYNEVYVSELCAAYISYSRRFEGANLADIMPESLYNYKQGTSIDVLPGEVYVQSYMSSEDYVVIEGGKYTIGGFIGGETNESFENFAEKNGMTDMEDFVSKALEEGTAKDEFSASCAWFWTKYADMYRQYIGYNIADSAQLYAFYNYDYDIALLVTVDDPELRQQLYASYMYYSEYGDFPSKDNQQYNDILSHSDCDQELDSIGQNFADEYMWYIESYTGNGNDTVYVMDDAGYTALSYALGENNYPGSYEYIYSYNDEYHSHSMVVYSGDREQTEKYLKEVYGSGILTQDDLVQSDIESQIEYITSNIVSMVVTLALILFCMFLIMRTQIMGSVREIGIYRAIGVSKKNLLFKHAVEGLLLTASTVFIGFLLASFIAFRVSSSSIVDVFLYYPVWLAVILGVFVFSCSVLFGLIPLSMLIRKSPSSILSKYDI